MARVDAAPAAELVGYTYHISGLASISGQCRRPERHRRRHTVGLATSAHLWLAESGDAADRAMMLRRRCCADTFYRLYYRTPESSSARGAWRRRGVSLPDVDASSRGRDSLFEAMAPCSAIFATSCLYRALLMVVELGLMRFRFTPYAFIGVAVTDNALIDVATADEHRDAYARRGLQPIGAASADFQ